MKLPWQGKTGLAKSTAFFATLLLVSLGLCGTNLVVINIRSISESGILTTVLVAIGFAELAGILVGIIGLITVAVLAILRPISSRTDQSSAKENSD